MSSVRYPVALYGIDVLQGWTAKAFACAARESEAVEAAGKDVQFVSETLGLKFATQTEAVDYYNAHYPQLLDDGFGQVHCRTEPVKSSKVMTPVMTDGKRWPAPSKPVKSMWQLSLSYWKIIAKRHVKPVAGMAPYIQARAVRKKALGQALTPEEVQSLAVGPLMSYRPQKALDIGLFEFIPPGNPGIIIADE